MVGLVGSFRPAPALAATGTNQQINFQGRLLTNSGAVVADGNYNMRFKIYQDGNGCVGGGSSPCSGTLKWTETHTNNGGTYVVVKNGYFSVSLGAVTAFGASVDWDQDTLWLSMDITTNGTDVSIPGSLTWNGEMLPFKRLSSAVYALNSNQLGGLTSGQFVQNVSPAASQQTANINILSGAATGVAAMQVQTVASATAPVLVLKGGATPGAGADLLQVQNSSGTPLARISSAGDFYTAGNLQFSQGLSHTINIAQAASGVGNDLSVAAGQSGTGANNGGNLVLQAGATGGSGITGSVIVRANGTNSTTAFVVQNSSSANLLRVDTANDRVGINIGGNPASTLEVGGTLRLSGSAVENYTTPLGGTVGTKINVPNFDPGAFGQLVALGLPTTATSSSRALSLFDGRTVAHQPTLAVLSPDQNNIIGLNWNGASTTGYFQSTDLVAGGNSISVMLVSGSVAGGSGGNSGDVTVRSGTTTGGTGNTTGNVYIVSGDGGGTNTTTGNAVVDSGAKTGSGTTGAVNIGITNSTSVVVGRAGGTVTLQGGTTKLSSVGASTANGAALCRDSSTTNLISCDANTTGRPYLQGGNTFGAAGDLGTNDNFALNLRTNNATRLTVSTGGDLQFAQGGTRTINIAQASSGAGNGLTIAAGQSNTGAVNGGDLTLQGGATGGSGTTGSVIVKANGTNSTTAFQVQNAAGTGTALSVDTTNGGAVTLASLQPASAAGNGTAASTVLTVTGAQGGNTSGTANTAGAGGAASFASGAGGNATAATGTSTAGAGGGVSITSGAGGVNSNAAGTNGNGGDITLQGGAAGTGGTGGRRGYVALQASGGNVGIGTAAPARTLEVANGAANSSAPQLLVSNSSASTTADATIEVKTSVKSFQLGLDATDQRFKIASSTSNASSSFGNQTAGPATDTGDSGVINCAKQTANGTGTITSLSVYIGSALGGAGNNNYQMALYDHDSGNNRPGNKLVASASGTLTASAWNTIPVTASVTNASIYWICYNANGLNGTVDNFMKATTGGTVVWLNSQVLGTWPSTFGAPTSSSSENPSMYATFTATGASYDSYTTPLVSMGDTGDAIFKNSINSTASFQVQNASGTAFLTVDSINERLYVGPTAGDTVGALLVLGVKTNTGDPSGVAGAMYYNNSMARFRCYGDGKWRFCNDPAGLTWGYDFREDFTGAWDNLSANSFGQNGFFRDALGAGSSITAVIADVASRPGQMQLDTGTTTTGRANIYDAWGNTTAGTYVPLYVGGGEEIEMAINIPTLADATNDYIIRIGLCDNNPNGSTDCASGLYFDYTRATSTNWQIAAAAGGTRTRNTGTTTVAAATGWHRFKMVVNSNATSVEYYIDGVDMGAITTNIPTTSANASEPSFTIYKTAGTTSRSIKVDYFEYRNTLTTAR